MKVPKPAGGPGNSELNTEPDFSQIHSPWVALGILLLSIFACIHLFSHLFTNLLQSSYSVTDTGLSMGNSEINNGGLAPFPGLRERRMRSEVSRLGECHGQGPKEGEEGIKLCLGGSPERGRVLRNDE